MKIILKSGAEITTEDVKEIIEKFGFLAADNKQKEYIPYPVYPMQPTDPTRPVYTPWATQPIITYLGATS